MGEAGFIYDIGQFLRTIDSTHDGPGKRRTHSVIAVRRISPGCGFKEYRVVLRRKTNKQDLPLEGK